jgi:hypothetical protein
MYVCTKNPQQSVLSIPSRVARWHIFKPKFPIWVNFGGPWVGKCWYILWPFGIFYGYLGYVITICYILCSFGTFCPVLVLCTNKNLTTLIPSRVARWHIFKPKFPIWVNFGGACNVRCRYICGHLVYFTALWYILWPFGRFYIWLFARFFTCWYFVHWKIWQPGFRDMQQNVKLMYYLAGYIT